MDVVVPAGVLSVNISVRYRANVPHVYGVHSRTDIYVDASFWPNTDYSDNTFKLAIVEKRNVPWQRATARRMAGLVTDTGWFVASSQYSVLPTTIPQRAPSIFPGDYFPPYNAPTEWDGRGLEDKQYAGHSGQTSADAWFRHNTYRTVGTAGGRSAATHHFIVGIMCEEPEQWVGFVKFGVKEVFTSTGMDGQLLIYHPRAPASASPTDHGFRDLYHAGSHWGATEMPKDFRDALDLFNQRFKTDY